MTAIQTQSNKVEKRGRGQPTKYRPDRLDEVRAWVRAGYTREDISVQLNVSVAQMCVWMQKYPEFFDAMNAERMRADSRVAESLYQRATGQTRKTTRKVVTKEDGTQEIHETYETLPPDVNAQRYWLNNRAPKVWRERSEVTGADGAPIAVNLSWLGTGRAGLTVDAEVSDVPYREQSDGEQAAEPTAARVSGA